MNELEAKIAAQTKAVFDASFPNANASPREAAMAAFYECEGNNEACVSAAIDAYEAAIKSEDRHAAALIREAAALIKRAEPVAYQIHKDGKWVECSEFVAKGWGNTVSDGCRALYLRP